MATKIPKGTTFVGWLEDFIKLPGDVATKTIAVIKTTNQSYLGLRAISRAPVSGVTNPQFMAALVEGEDASNDIKGVNTTVDLQKFTEDPIKTLKALGNRTINDIFNIDELATDRRRDTLTKFLNGKAIEEVAHLSEDDQKRELNKPESGLLDNNIIKSFNKIAPLTEAPFDPRTGKSTIQMVVPNTAPNKSSIKMEDRRTVEENEWGKRSTIPKTNRPRILKIYKNVDDKNVLIETEQEDQFKTYKGMATAAAKLAGGMERVEPRIMHRDAVLKDYNRTIARELGIDLNEVLSPDSLNLTNKTFARTLLEDYGGDVEAMIADKATGKGLAKAFNLSKSQLELLDQDKLGPFFEQLARSEDINHRLLLNDLPFKQNGAQYIEVLKDIKIKLPDGTEKTLSFSTKIGNKQYAKGTGKGLSNHINANFIKTDMENEGSIRLIEAAMTAEFYQEKIKAFIKKQTQERAEQVWKETYEKVYKAEKLAGRRDLGHIPGSIYRKDSSRIARASNAATRAANEAKTEIIRTGERTLERLESANKVKDIANGLFFAGTMKDFLSAVQNGKVLDQLLVTSRLLGAVPWAKIRSGSEIAGLLDINNVFGENNRISKITRFIIKGDNSFKNKQTKMWVKDHVGLDKIPQYLGLTADFKGDMAGFLKLKKSIGIRWTAPNAKWTKYAIVKASQASGLFGGVGVNVYTVLDVLEANSQWNAFNAQTLLSSKGNITNFLDQLSNVGNAMSNRLSLDGFNSQFIEFAKSLGFEDEKILKGFLKNYEQFKTKGGWTFLENMKSKLDVSEMDRWNFIRNLVDKQGVVGEFGKSFVGILDIYNMGANQARSFIFKNILFNDALATKFKLAKWGQNIIKKIGLSDEVRLLEAIGRWGFVKAVKDMGNALKMLSTLGRSSLAYEQSLALLTLRSTRPGRLLVKFFVSSFGKKFATSAIFKSLGYLLSSAAGLMTGGISWVLTIFGGAIWKVTKGLFVGIFKRDWGAIKAGFQEAWEEIKGIWNVAKKLIIYPILGIVIGCFGLIIIVIIIFASFIAPLQGLFNNEKNTNVANVVKTQTDLIKVEKTSEYIPNENPDKQGYGRINYKIKITNPEKEPVTIKEIKDRIVFVGACDNNGQDTVITSESDNFPGTYTIEPPNLKISGTNVDVPIQITDTTIEGLYTLSLQDVSLPKKIIENSTYINTITVKIDEDKLPATATTTTKIGDGGCVQCPTGWPTTGYLTQGPGGKHETLKGVGGEAIDIADSVESHEIYATMPGTIIVPNFDSDENGVGFGNYIKLKNYSGETEILYAHMSKILVNTGDTVTKGQLLGYTGNTGTIAQHLHYDFENDPTQTTTTCLDIPLTFKKIKDNMFVPKTVKNGCIGMLTSNGQNGCGTDRIESSY